MYVRIKRNTGWRGSGSAIPILINGKKATEIAHKQEIEVAIPRETATLQVAQTMGGKSKELIVTSGDTIEVTTSKFFYFLYFISALFPLIAFFLNRSFGKKPFFLLLVIFLVIISISFSLPYYHVEIIDTSFESKK